MDSDQEEETRPQSPLSISHYQAQIRALNTTIQDQNATIARLRESRGIHRSNVQTLTTENTALTTTNTALTITNAELEEKIKTLTVKEEAISEAIAEPLDSDMEDQPIKLEKKKTHVITPTITAPATNSDVAPTVITPTVVIGNNKKYPDMPYFYGEKEKWDEWRFHLDAKFR
ncbi:hypothetical protein BDR22DRAFT_822135 [Usnea florida]